MKHLLDVNVLLASVWTTHPQHAIATAWFPGKEVVVCPISELGFLRIGTHKKACNYTMADARTGLEKFLSERKVAHIPDDLRAVVQASRIRASHRSLPG